MRATFAVANAFLALALLAGRALAINIVIGGAIGNITADSYLTTNDTRLNDVCEGMCKPGVDAIDACDNDDNCLCNADTVSKVTACQQCYFTWLIEDNRKYPNALNGQTDAQTAYVTACNASDAHVVVPATSVALTLPESWDGPVAQHLSTGATVVYFISVLTIGVGLISIICTM
ncbi:hypothetical protein PENSPDRAFT_757882 [Peniophora sp. CONT]|nr:hypothetical protein PENSPDRAFT_757882 [Peniophora sp. CONT]